MPRRSGEGGRCLQFRASRGGRDLAEPSGLANGWDVRQPVTAGGALWRGWSAAGNQRIKAFDQQYCDFCSLLVGMGVAAAKLNGSLAPKLPRILKNGLAFHFSFVLCLCLMLSWHNIVQKHLFRICKVRWVFVHLWRESLGRASLDSTWIVFRQCS